MKEKAGPAAIIAGVIIALLIVYAAYHYAFAPQSPPASRDYMPDYAKQRSVKPGEEGNAGAGAATATPYGQGYGQRPGAGGMTSGGGMGAGGMTSGGMTSGNGGAANTR